MMDAGEKDKRHGQTRSDSGAGGDILPGAPRIRPPRRSFLETKPATPSSTFEFFFKKFVGYGLAFGMMYGAGAEVFIACGMRAGMFGLIGIPFGAEIGALAGLALGFLDGLALGISTAKLIARGVSVPEVCRKVRILAPIASTMGGAIMVLGIIGNRGIEDVFQRAFISSVWAIAVIASWHASTIITEEFEREHE